ncbi:MAG: hypothetical protein MUF34_37530, partial [Polyangiaceae bacterium]|nr:hypothetical protein [Polyangiaceae bacterium]
AHAFDANGYFVVAQDNTVVLPAGAAALVSNLIDLQNGPDSLVLVSPGPSSVTLDALGYSDAAGQYAPPNVFAGEGTTALQPAGANAAASLSRLPDGSDTSNNSVDFKFGTKTPGASNTPVP